MQPALFKDAWSAGARYEPYVGRWSRLVARELLEWLSISVQKDWLDEGCGTGALSQIILEHGLPHAHLSARRRRADWPPMLNKGSCIATAMETLNGILRRMENHQVNTRSMLQDLNLARDFSMP